MSYSLIELSGTLSGRLETEERGLECSRKTLLWAA